MVQKARLRPDLVGQVLDNVNAKACWLRTRESRTVSIISRNSATVPPASLSNPA